MVEDVKDMMYDLTTTRYTYGGETMGRLPDGRAVFIPYTLTGETVRVRLVEEKRRFARGELLEVLQASSQRITPRCMHFKTCGGCHYQHMPYELQLEVKRRVLIDQLERIGKIKNPPVQPILPSPQQWNYRNYVQFHSTPAGKLAFKASRSEQLIPIQECHLPDEAINSVWQLMDLEGDQGLDRLGFRVGLEDDLMLVVQSSDPQAIEFQVDLPISAVYLGPGGAIVLAGEELIAIEVLGRTFQVSAGSFFQVNTSMAGEIVKHIRERVPLGAEIVFIDAFCGVGLFSAFVAPHVGRLIGIETSESACRDFEVNLDEFENVELYEAPVEVVLSQLDVKPNVILVDPPRSGLSRQCLDSILSSSPQTIVYVSCDPATLARDAHRLVTGGYQLTEVVPFDLFPQTYHIESVSIYQKGG